MCLDIIILYKLTINSSNLILNTFGLYGLLVIFKVFSKIFKLNISFKLSLILK